jgi:hypothetical protein
MTSDERQAIIDGYFDKNDFETKVLCIKEYYSSLSEEIKVLVNYRQLLNWINDSSNSIKNKRARFSEDERNKIATHYWNECSHLSVCKFIQIHYEEYNESTLKRFIYDYKTSMDTEKRIFNNYIYNGMQATEVNDFIQSKDIYKCDELRVQDVLGMRFGVVAINPIIAENQHYLCMYSTVISNYISTDQMVYAFGSTYQKCGKKGETGKYCIVADQNEAGFGPFMNDALDKNKNNCGLKIIKENGKEFGVVVALRDIQPGEECCIEYGKGYWKYYFINFLMEESLARKIKLYYNI